MTSYYYPHNAERRIRVVLADQHTIVRQGMTSLLEKVPGIDVVADTGDGESLLELARKLVPDVIVTEICLSGMNGLEAARRMAAEGLPCRILFLTGSAERDLIINAFESDALGYILKDADAHCLPEGIRTVHALGTYLGPKVSDILVRKDAAPGPSDRPAIIAGLTAREQEILKLLAEGNNSKDIAFILGISNKTVDTFRRNCMRKLRLKNGADLIKYALREGMVRL